MHAPLHQSTKHYQTEGSVQLATLNDAVLFMEKHFFQLKLHLEPEAILSRQFIFMMRSLTLLENRRIRLKRILERTYLLKDNTVAEENWIHFNNEVDRSQKKLLRDIAFGRFDEQHAMFFIKRSFEIINVLVKFKLQYYKNQMLDQNITCDEILEEDKELDIDLNDPKNYSFRLYLKNSKAGARIKRVFIDSFGFDNINLADDIFGNGKEKVAEKLQKKFSLRIGKNDNDKASQAGGVLSFRAIAEMERNRRDRMRTDSLGDATLAAQQFDLENNNIEENNNINSADISGFPITNKYESEKWKSPSVGFVDSASHNLSTNVTQDILRSSAVCLTNSRRSTENNSHSLRACSQIT